MSCMESMTQGGFKIFFTKILGPIRSKVRPPSRPRRHSHPRLPALRHVRRRGAHRQAGGRAHRARPGLHHLQVHQDQGLASRRVLLLLPARRARRHCRLFDPRQDVPRVGGAHRRYQLVRLHPLRVRHTPGGDVGRNHHRALQQPGTSPAGERNARFHPITRSHVSPKRVEVNNHRKRPSIRVSSSLGR